MKRELFLFVVVYIMAYGNASFCQTLNGHEYVDLGLPSGTKWATCNIGATKETDYGDYFAWGETITKDIYNWDTYAVEDVVKLPDSLYVDKDGFTHTLEGPEINNIAGTPFDAATVNWGNGWRMPTKEEYEELLYECEWVWVSKNGVNGLKGTGSNGNYIFLPAAGIRSGSSLLYADSDGCYWSSSLHYQLYDAWSVDYTSVRLNLINMYRDVGRSVRAVCQ